ncbi:MAG: hypothetical protein PHD43_21980 [Methylococcales bacterium]|nr:hypothetical protein [Methylococcales bacterium]
MQTVIDYFLHLRLSKFAFGQFDFFANLPTRVFDLAWQSSQRIEGCRYPLRTSPVISSGLHGHAYHVLVKGELRSGNIGMTTAPQDKIFQYQVTGQILMYASIRFLSRLGTLE